MGERARVDELFASPRPPSPRALLAAPPRLAASRRLPLVPIEGRPPDLIAPIPGCTYAPRCDAAEERCHREHPPTYAEEGARRDWACWVAGPDGELPPVAKAGAYTPQEHKTVTDAPLLEVDALVRTFPVRRRTSPLRRTTQYVSAVDGVGLSIAPGETVGLVGESGCGKSSVANALLGIHPATSGTIRFDGRDVGVLRGA